MYRCLFKIAVRDRTLREGRLTRDHRRLAAIVSADVVGYSLLMGRDDSATLAGLKAHRRELIDPKIAEYGGRIVKTTGDGLLLEFPSVVDAVRCAVDIQRGMAERNAGVSPEQRIDFRIGINVGDIIIDGEDIFGDGVNVAARLQTMAEPGGIRTSRVVRDQVHDKLSFTFEELGPQEVKNIARPVEVYRVDLGSEALQKPSGGRRRWRRLTQSPGWRWLGAGIVVLLIGGTTAWYVQSLRTTPREAGAPAFSIAILPFASPGATGADELIAKGLAPDLTEAFGKTNRYVWVISPGLAATYAGKAIDPRAVGRELNVRYLVEGELRRTPGRLALTATLIDAATATQLWSAKVEIPDAKTGVTSTDLPPQLLSGLRDALVDAETRRVAKQDPAAASAMDHVIRGWAIEDGGYSLDRFLAAKKAYEEALRLDPNLVSALVNRARMNVEIARLDPQADRQALLREADQLTSRAVALDHDEPRAWATRGWVLAWQRRWEESLTAYRESLRIVPNRGATINYMAIVLNWSGRAEESLPWIDKALASEASEGGALFADLLQRKCGAYMMLGRYAEAVAACEKSAGLGGDVFTYIYLTAAYAQQGENAKAVAAREQVFKLWPNFALARWPLLTASDSPVYWQQLESHVLTGLRKAEVPEN
jgi:class 3 adenylate cyclase/TolB-like protein/Flp pilus assembly protein TadD